MTLMGAVPLFFELTCESTYPIAEGVTNGFLTWLNNIPGLILLLVLMVPSIGTKITFFISGKRTTIYRFKFRPRLLFVFVEQRVHFPHTFPVSLDMIKIISKNSWTKFILILVSRNCIEIFTKFRIVFSLSGKAWTNWSMLGCIIASIPILLLFRERYSRLDIDTHTRGSRGSQASVNGDRDFMDSLGASPRMDNPIYS